MIIPRDRYLDLLISKKHNGLIKVVTGMRRCGKSFLLFTLFKNHLIATGVNPDHIIEIALDLFENLHLQNAEAFYAHVKQHIVDGDQYYLLLDEIQLLEKFEYILNSFSRMPNVDIFVTGSNARLLSKDVITEFRGRGDEIRLYPLSFKEFYSAYDGDVASAWEEYMTYGGLPLVLSFADDTQKSSFLKSIFAETYLADISNRYAIKHKAELEELLNILSSGIGSLTNPNKLANTFKSVKGQLSLTPPTIKQYIEYLEDAFLLTGSYRYDIKGNRYINTPLKYYFTDLGLRNARLNFRQLEESHLMENILFNELNARGFSVDVGVVENNIVDADGKRKRVQFEVDFVCNLSSKRYYIQSALTLPSTEKREQEERSLLNLGDNFKKIIITKDQLPPHYTQRGILMLNLFDFLLDEELINF